MRLRRRHAWGAVLIALFALPVLKPDGAGRLEEGPGAILAELASVEALNPRLWERAPGQAEGGERARELERVLAEMVEARFVDAGRRTDLQALTDTLELDRQPLVKRARILRNRDPSGARRSILIDRGHADGIVEGCAVVAGGVFVGRAQVVREDSTLVRLVTDPQTKLEVALRTASGTRVTGVLRRRGPASAADDLEVSGLRLGSGVGPVREHVPVLTSNADLRVPAGLVVGYVSSVSDPEADGFPTLGVRPALDLARSTEVLVLLPR